MTQPRPASCRDSILRLRGEVGRPSEGKRPGLLPPRVVGLQYLLQGSTREGAVAGRLERDVG